MIPIICRDCRNRRHGECKGGTWCDCAHRPGTALPRREEPPEPPADDTRGCQETEA